MLNQTYVLEHTSPLGHYTAQALIIRCFDDRFYYAVKNFLKQQEISVLDHISVAGGAKALASPEEPQDRDYMLREIDKSVRLHGTARVMLFTHYDCGAYGGLAQFGGDEEKQFAFHADELRKAAAAVRERFGRLAVETYFIDKEGVIRVK